MNNKSKDDEESTPRFYDERYYDKHLEQISGKIGAMASKLEIVADEVEMWSEVINTPDGKKGLVKDVADNYAKHHESISKLQLQVTWIWRILGASWFTILSHYLVNKR
ncbi:hypothetical protein KAR91_10625 [Candidatus Pacearchaeota archaeon]|nr:hypothetical protein [Candidatus Pacearchaeota archaeon]